MAVDKHGAALAVGDLIQWQRAGSYARAGCIRSISGNQLQVDRVGARKGECRVGARTAERARDELQTGATSR